ncbi:sulfite exporter TauE/SafE family protein [Variovorax robiniae]|uniref:Probable membrane transporter protein n=1 Tax=Variovorax robiniae TaxID=1836199 RepID=A0ABU8X6D8_9BURK
MTIWTAWLATAAVFLMAGMVKGVIGLGLPTVSMAMLALWMPPAQAAALLIVPSLVTNVWQAGPLKALPGLLRRLGGMQVGIVLGTLGGSVAFGAPSGAGAEVVLGLALIGYAIWGLAGWRVQVPERHAGWLGPLAGALTGLLTALTGVFVLPAVPYLQGLALERDALIQAMGISFTTSTLALAGGLALSGGYAGASLQSSLPMLLPALLGMVAGTALRQRLPVATFRRCFFAGLALLGAYMAAKQLLA